MTDSIDDITLLDRQQLAKALGYSPWTIDDWVRKGLFPKPMKLGPGRTQKWRLVDVKIWIKRELRKPRDKAKLKGAVRKRMENK